MLLRTEQYDIDVTESILLNHGQQLLKSKVIAATNCCESKKKRESYAENLPI